MPPVLSRWIPRATVALLVVAAGLLAWREGGGADARAPAPHASAATGDPSHARAIAHGAEAYEVTTRLLDSLADAHVEVPSLAAAQPYFQSHWRKLRGPWTRSSGAAAPLPVTVALRTSRDAETQWSVPVQGGQTWVPEARIWNMNEGSFEQREALYAPTPATLALRVAVPPRARLRLSPAVATPLPLTTVFDVSVVDVAGNARPLSRTRVPGTAARRWTDLDLDLAPWAGQKVELRLRTWAEHPAAHEPTWAPGPADATASGDDPSNAAEPAPPVPPMALALWGDPVIVARQPTRVPYDVLWIVVDALRPDVAASLHDPADDAAKLAAARPPLEALLPAVPGLMPGLDRLAARGVRFPHAWSAGAWTRPGTLAMLTGERSSELGVDTLSWVQPPASIARYYASDPPLVPLILRRSGVVTAAFVNNFFMAGYAAVGLDTGFARVTDHRYRTRDTAEIERDALAWLDAHAGDRFFLFVNFNSPHEPYDPPPEMLARIPPPPAGPQDAHVRAYMAEGAKDDQAIAALLDKIDEVGLARSTVVVVTSDHGETLSSAHDAKGLEGMPMRFHHAVGNFEETTRIPLVMALPGVLDGGRAVADRVRSTDIAPTVLEVEGLEADPRMSGRSLLPLAGGAREADPRVVVSEGRGSRAILWGRWRMVVHDGHEGHEGTGPRAGDQAGAHPAPRPTPAPADAGPDSPARFEDELYDLQDDPGERRNVAREHPDVLAELKARLTAALAGARAADSLEGRAPTAALPTVHLRFAGGGRAHRVAGTLTAGDGKTAASLVVEPVGVARDAVRAEGAARVDFALTTPADGNGSGNAALGLDVRVDPPGAPLRWQLFLDDAPWPPGAIFTGPYGLPAVAARGGIGSDEARAEVYAPALPFIDPARDLGLFVTRDRPETTPLASRHGQAAAGPGEGGDPASEAATREMQRVLQDWGYAHGSH